MGKLTLHVPDRLVAAAKQEAASRRTSLSKRVSDYFRAFEGGSVVGGAGALPPITNSLLGCIHGSKDDLESKDLGSAEIVVYSPDQFLAALASEGAEQDAVRART